ncbi:hypothetical protein PENNAL_c1009G07419, partial [Penicillium nalgiovense]
MQQRKLESGLQRRDSEQSLALQAAVVESPTANEINVDVFLRQEPFGYLVAGRVSRQPKWRIAIFVFAV